MSLRLSVCIPTYNRAAWLRFNLPLWAEQAARFPDECEIVVSDNASSDDTAQAIEEAREFGPIRYNRNEQNIQANPNMHKVVAQVARGEFAWVVGDDDTPTEGAIERVLDVLRCYPKLNYVYVNFASWTSFGVPTRRMRAHELPLNCEAINPDTSERYLAQLKEIVGGDTHCFASIYTSILRREMLAQAFEGSLHAPPFSTLRSVVSHALYIADHCLEQPAFYLGRPGVISSADVSWPRFMPIYLLHLQPQLFDYFEAHGIEREVMNRQRQMILQQIPRILAQMLAVRDTPLRENFSFIDFLKRNWRFKNFPSVMLDSLACYIHLRVPKPLVRVLRLIWRGFRPAVASLLRRTSTQNS